MPAKKKQQEERDESWPYCYKRTKAFGHRYPLLAPEATDWNRLDWIQATAKLLADDYEKSEEAVLYCAKIVRAHGGINNSPEEVLVDYRVANERRGDLRDAVMPLYREATRLFPEKISDFRAAYGLKVVEKDLAAAKEAWLRMADAAQPPLNQLMDEGKIDFYPISLEDIERDFDNELKAISEMPEVKAMAEHGKCWEKAQAEAYMVIQAFDKVLAILCARYGKNIRRDPQGKVFLAEFPLYTEEGRSGSALYNKLLIKKQSAVAAVYTKHGFPLQDTPKTFHERVKLFIGKINNPLLQDARRGFNTDNQIQLEYVELFKKASGLFQEAITSNIIFEAPPEFNPALGHSCFDHLANWATQLLAHLPQKEKLKKVTTPRACREKANKKAILFLEKNPKATSREVATAIGCALGLVSKLPVWNAIQQARREGRAPKNHQLSQIDQDTIPAKTKTPSEEAESNEIQRLTKEQEADDKSFLRRAPDSGK